MLVKGTYSRRRRWLGCGDTKHWAAHGRRIPTVLDRCIQQAVLQVMPAEWDPTFAEHSFGFRPKRSAH